jgi:uncharacterized repeat protein (TIGR01451 family)
MQIDIRHSLATTLSFVLLASLTACRTSESMRSPVAAALSSLAAPAIFKPAATRVAKIEPSAAVVTAGYEERSTVDAAHAVDRGLGDQQAHQAVYLQQVDAQGASTDEQVIRATFGHLAPGLNGSPQAVDCQPGGADANGFTHAGCVSPDHMLPRPEFPHDEYLCDGGDSWSAAVVNGNYSIHGLDQEDTIAHFDTQDGGTLVQPSNRVCIYAPRFAAVRQVTSAVASERALSAAGVDLTLLPVGHEDTQIATTVDRPEVPIGSSAAKIANSLDEHAHSIGIDNRQGLLLTVDGLVPIENLKQVLDKELQTADRMRLAVAMDAAILWTDNKGVQVTMDGQEASLAISTQAVQSVYLYEVREDTRLKLVKMASAADAQPGDSIEFTLHFENTGGQTIGNITLADNLTSRLEYIDGSQESSLAANFSSSVNDGGSLALKWDLKDPLPPGEGGVIRFRCRVR